MTNTTTKYNFGAKLAAGSTQVMQVGQANKKVLNDVISRKFESHPQN